MSTRTVTMKGNPLRLVGEEMKEGVKAPSFQLLDKSLGPVALADYEGKWKIISVVPSLDTGVCDQQTRRFNKDAGEFEDVVVLTVSVDLPFAQARWCGAAGLDHVITLSDHRDVSFGESYGVLLPDLRLLCRAVFVLDQEDSIVYAEYVPEVTDHPDYEKALSALEKRV